MKRYLRVLLYTIVFCCLAFVLMQTVFAAEMRVTDDDINFRSEASMDSDVIMTVTTKTVVDVLEHDPTGWSKVKVNGTVGYIRSDYLAIPPGVEYVSFITTDDVNFRASPSLDSDVISTITTGSGVQVLEYNPTGWSHVRVNGTSGYAKSEFLTLPIQNAPQASNPASQTQSQTPQAQSTLKTIDGVNLRSGPSLDADIIRTVEAGISVEILDHDVNGWSKVTIEGTVGYIKSDFLSVNGRVVELLNWSVVRNMIKRGVPIYTIDVRTGRTFTIQCFSIGDHADVEPLTRADTDTMFDIRGGVWSWAARPVWVSIDGHLIAASIHGMPHDVSTIPDNGMNGHLCLHFLGSTTSSSSASYKADLQNAVQEAWNSR